MSQVGGGDRITEGLQKKLRAVEDKVQALQQQLLERLCGSNGSMTNTASCLDDEEEDGAEAIALLNERVEKLLRMRTQVIMTAIGDLNHSKVIIVTMIMIAWLLDILIIAR